jgi:nitrite reductase (NADH) small subunit
VDDFMRVASLAELPPGALKQVRVQQHVVCLVNIDGQISAVDNHCPHARWPLAQGYLDGEEIVCPGHGMLFNVPNYTLNACRVDSHQVQRFSVRLEDGAIWVAANPSTAGAGDPR